MKISVNVFVTVLMICAARAKVLPQKSQDNPKSYVKCTKKDQILWPDYSDKRNYFECIGSDNFVKRPCPAKTVFNYHKQHCTWPEEWIEPPEFTNLVEPLQSSFDFSPSCFESDLHLLWPDPQTSHIYFRCTGIGQSERLSCQLGQIFVFLIQKCIAEPQTTTTTVRPIDRYPNCTVNEAHLSWPDPWYPQNYFTCTGIGEFELHECFNGKVFVFMMQMCISNDGVTTVPTFTPSSTESMTTEETSTSSSHVTTSEITTIVQESTTSEVTTSTSSGTTEGLQTAPTFVPHPFSFPKLRCLICWRPTCEFNELHMKWPDYDYPKNYFQCLSEGVFILKSCGENFTFDISTQECVKTTPALLLPVAGKENQLR